MKVFLRLGQAGLYYGGPEHWVRDRQHALDLKTIQRATELGRDQEGDSLVIVVSSGHSSCDWFLPLRHRQLGRAVAAPPGVPTQLPRAA